MTEVVPAQGKGAALLAQLEAAGALSSVGLRLTDPNLTFETYAAVGELLGEMRKALQWSIGDYILLGEKLFGERSYQAFESLNASEEVLREYTRVAQRVPRSIRRSDLPWSTHRAIASLEPPEQKRWLKVASEQGMSHHQLREALRSGEEPKHSDVCRCCHRPL